MTRIEDDPGPSPLAGAALEADLSGGPEYAGCAGAVEPGTVLRPNRLAALVAEYVRRWRRPADRELAYFRARQTDAEAISDAALARLPGGKRHPHQYRVPLTALSESRKRLLENLMELRTCGSFDELIRSVERLIRPIPGIGELAVYDTAHRVGARLGVTPAKVYLHAGTRDGAKTLGLDWKRPALEMTELPPELQALTAQEAEDFLCIYREYFTALQQPPTGERVPNGSCAVDDGEHPTCGPGDGPRDEDPTPVENTKPNP
jgi:hypothetical protein